MSQGRQRKLAALALAYLVPTANPVILSRLSDLVALWSSVLAQTEETDQGEYVVAWRADLNRLVFLPPCKARVTDTAPVPSAELYHIPDDYQSDVEVDYTETPETNRRQAVSTGCVVQVSHVLLLCPAV